MARHAAVWGAIVLGLVGLMLAVNNLTVVIDLPPPVGAITSIVLLPVSVLLTALAFRYCRWRAIPAILITFCFVAVAGVWLVLAYVCGIMGKCL